MKKYSFNKIILPVLILFGGFIAGCEKDDGPIKKDTLKDLEEVPAVIVKLDKTGSQSIDLNNLGSFQGKFKVEQYFPNAPRPEKVDVVIKKTNASGSSVKTFKEGVANLPAEFTVTSADLQGLFGTIELGDSYDVSVDVYANGKKYEAFPKTGIGTAGGPKNRPGYSELVRYGAICAYDPNIYEGNFEVVVDEWGDYAPGDVIPIVRVSDTEFSFKFADASGNLPIIVKVNTGNNVTTVTKQKYTTNGYGTAYTNFSVETVAGSSDNFVAPCDEIFSVKLAHTVDQGSFGSFIFKAKKVH